MGKKGVSSFLPLSNGEILNKNQNFSHLKYLAEPSFLTVTDLQAYFFLKQTLHKICVLVSALRLQFSFLHLALSLPGRL